LTRIEILSTYPDILKLGVRSTEPSMLEIINEANDELQILSYAITAGANNILEAIDEALRRGIKLTFIINSNENLSQEINDFLYSMKNKYNYCKIYLFNSSDSADLHAKILVADRKIAIVGSSNLTSRGLIWNLEIGFLIEDKSVWKLAEVVDKIVEMSTPL
jgi:cardiolipin synthase